MFSFLHILDKFGFSQKFAFIISMCKPSKLQIFYKKNNHKHKVIYFLIHPCNRFTFNLFPIYSSLFHSHFKFKSICFNLNWIQLYLISLCFKLEFNYFTILFRLFNSINTNEFYLINYHPSNSQCISNINNHPKSTLNQLYIFKSTLISYTSKFIDI